MGTVGTGNDDLIKGGFLSLKFGHITIFQKRTWSNSKMALSGLSTLLS